MKKNTCVFMLYSDGNVIVDNIQEEDKKEISSYLHMDNCNQKIISNSKDIRLLIKSSGKIKVVMISNLEQHLRKDSILYAEACFILSRVSSVNEELESTSQKINGAFLRLTHNIRTLSTLNIQDIECFSPMGSTQDSNVRKLSDWRLFVDELDNDNKLQLAKMLLRVYKNTQHIQNDIIVYNRLLNNIDEEKEFIMHPLHKVVMRSVFSCASPLMEAGVKLEIGQTEKLVLIDYTNIQVALFYILDNIVKYIRPNTTLKIKFEYDRKTKVNSVLFEMESLLVRKDEVSKIFDEGFSGREAINCKKNGSGIGLFISKKLINENDADINFITDGEVKDTAIGRNFGYNKIRIDFNKS